MKTTLDYLDDVKKKYKLKSDYALADFLQLRTTAISNYRNRRSRMDNTAALRVAKALNIPEIEVIAVACAERARTPEEKKSWQEVLQRIGKRAAVVFMTLGVSALLQFERAVLCILC